MTSTYNSTGGGVYDLPQHPEGFVRDLVRNGDHIMNQVNSQVSRNPTVGIPSSTSNADGGNKPVVHSIFPKRWGNGAKLYDQYIFRGDLLFADSFDRIKRTHQTFPEQTCLNFQSLQSHICDRRREALESIYNIHKTQGYSTILDYSKLDIDYGVLVDNFKTHRGHFNGFNYEKNGEMSREMEKINEGFVDGLLKEAEEARGILHGIDEEFPLVLSSLRNYSNLTDNNVRCSAIMDYSKMVSEWMVYLHPKLITNRWKFLGVVTGTTDIGTNFYTGYALQKGISYASSGKISLKNVYGVSKIRSSIYTNRRSRMDALKRNNIPILKEYNTLYLYLTKSDIQKKTVSGMRFHPYVIKPITAPNQREAETFMEREFPIIESTTSYTKIKGRFEESRTEKIRINRGYVCSWTVGQVRIATAHPKLSENFYLVSTGQTEEDIKTVLGCRNKVTDIVIENKNKKY